MTFNTYLFNGNPSRWSQIESIIRQYMNNLNKTILINKDGTPVPIQNDLSNQIVFIIGQIVIVPYNQFEIIYTDDDNSNVMFSMLSSAILKNIPNIVNTLRQQRVAVSTWWDEIENYGYFNTGNNSNENSYNGYDADGVFSRSKNTMASKNGDVLGYLLKMNKPINNVLNILCSDIEMLLQTIY